MSSPPPVLHQRPRPPAAPLTCWWCAVTLMVSGVAVLGFRHASQLQEQVQQPDARRHARADLNLARDTANVATAAVRLSQVVGALEYKGEARAAAGRCSTALQPLAGPAGRRPRWRSRSRRGWRDIIRRSNALQQSVAGDAGARPAPPSAAQRAAQRAVPEARAVCVISPDLNRPRRGTMCQIDPRRLAEMDRLIVAAIHTAYAAVDLCGAPAGRGSRDADPRAPLQPRWSAWSSRM